MDALFVRNGELFEPTTLTTGPWRADAMHGGPPAALLAHEAGQHVADGEYIARVNVELERPVPLAPLSVVATRRNVSRRVAHIDVVVTAGQQTVLSGRALVLAVAPNPEPQWVPASSARPVPDESNAVRMAAFASGDVPVCYHRDAVEHRVTEGNIEVPGPVVAWVRLRGPVVQDEPTSGVCRVLAAADFGSGVSAVYRFQDGFGLINADLSVTLQREPRGEWIRLQSETRVDPSGTAVGLTMLADADGDLGVATQSLLGISTS